MLLSEIPVNVRKPLRAAHAVREADALNACLSYLSMDKVICDIIVDEAVKIVRDVREKGAEATELESFLMRYGLDTAEGRALMTLAEALLRVPDKETANLLIRDRMNAASWKDLDSKSKGDVVAGALGKALKMTGSLVARPHSKNVFHNLLSAASMPVVRSSMQQAMKALGQKFVLGQDIDDAIDNAAKDQENGTLFSYDMLGEGARTGEDAERYYQSYMDAIIELAKRGQNSDPRRAPGISVKLSALHPRFEHGQAERCVPELADKVQELAKEAAFANISLIIDAEECDRLELTLAVIDKVLSRGGLRGWDGLGLAVQAYQKRALAVIDVLADMAERYSRKIIVRLVKGAYWDSEIKRSQVEGLIDYPVYTRKVNTDVSYLACARKLFDRADLFYPAFGTHNAHTIAAIQYIAADNKDYEFQRLHGMGEALFDYVTRQDGAPRVRVYAPVGPYQDLLPYLVRRMLENGANSSFVRHLRHPDVLPESLVADPVAKAAGNDSKVHPQIPRPVNIYGQSRKNSRGLDLHDAQSVQGLQMRIDKAVKGKSFTAGPIINGRMERPVAAHTIFNPADIVQEVGKVWYAQEDHVERSFRGLSHGFQKWSSEPAEIRARHIERLADLLESHRTLLMGLCVREAGKTVADALAEVREAVDFCRYYAMQARKTLGGEVPLSGPTGESNRLSWGGRGVFVCISPWNFPLAIFTGQVVAALAAGNTVLAKPAEQTSLIAAQFAQLAFKAGIPENALSILPGDGGEIGPKILRHPDVAGVAFTGGTETAWAIQKTLAERRGPIVPFIAETGGQNAMIVDSTALLEQVVDDVVLSAFGSAGQRCSALRVLFVQDEIADPLMDMIAGKMDEMVLGDPSLLSSDVGPIIDGVALADLIRHRTRLKGTARLVGEVPWEDHCSLGHFFAPSAWEIGNIAELEKEVFGPILHIVRYSAQYLDNVIESINDTGYGLTLGVHSRIESRARDIVRKVRVGNAYVNRTTIGAVVGVQPFGGQGLSGTGPKAGGPHYLQRFATEKVTSIDTTASGGNASLVCLGE